MRYTILCGNDDPIQIPAGPASAMEARQMARRLSALGDVAYIYQWWSEHPPRARPWEAYRGNRRHGQAHATYPAL